MFFTRLTKNFIMFGALLIAILPSAPVYARVLIGPSFAFGFSGYYQNKASKATTEDTSKSVSSSADEGRDNQFFGPTFEFNFAFANDSKKFVVGAETGYQISLLNQKTNGAVDSADLMVQGGKLGFFLRPNPAVVVKAAGIYHFGDSSINKMDFFTDKELLAAQKAKKAITFEGYGADIGMGGSLVIDNGRSGNVYVDFSFHYITNFIQKVIKKKIDTKTRLDSFLFLIGISIPVQ